MSKDNVFWILVIIVGLLLAGKMGWLPQPGGGGQPTAVPAPQLVPVQTAVPASQPASGMATAVPVETWAGAAPTAVPDLVIISPPATWTAVPPATVTAVPPPAQAHSLQDVFLIYREAAAPCINAIQMNQPLTAVCQTIRADLIRIAAEQGARP